MDVIDILALTDIRKERGGAQDAQAVPAHMRHLHLPRQGGRARLRRDETQPLVHAVLIAAVEEHLHPETYAEEGSALPRGVQHGALRARGAELGTSVRKRAHAGQDDPVRACDDCGIGRDLRLRPDKAQGTRQREEVAHPVIYYGYHSVPFVLGSTSARAASTEHASLSALPKDLNTASADVVDVVAREHPEMQRHARRTHERSEKLSDELGVEVAHLILGREDDVEAEIGAAR